MDCPFCGVKLPDNVVVCPVCGEEIQVISAVDALEDEILQEFVDEDNKPKDIAENGVSGAASETAKGKKNIRTHRKRRILILIVIVAAVIAAASAGGVTYSRNHSAQSLLTRAEKAYDREDYDRAVRCLDRLFALEDNEEGFLLAGKVYAAMGDYDAAEQMLLNAIGINPASSDAYRELLEVYSVQGKKDEILNLKHTVTDEGILALFDDYLTPAPEITPEGGTYSDYFTVEILAPKNGLTVYYTTDGSDPTLHGILYTGPVQIGEQGSTLLTAVCMDEEGDFSEPVSETYFVSLPVPDMPVAVPDGGQFTYPQTVTVSAPAGTKVYYTWDGTTPNENSSVYTSPIDIPEGNHVLSLIAVDERGMYSEVLRCNYIYYPETYVQSIDSSSYSEEWGQEDTELIQGDEPDLWVDEEETEDEIAAEAEEIDEGILPDEEPAYEEPSSDDTTSEEPDEPAESSEPVPADEEEGYRGT